MTPCANCLDDAIVEYPIAGDTRIFYCEKHIPSFLLKPAYKGRLNYNLDVAASVAENGAEESAVEQPSKKKSSKTSTEETTTTKTPAEAEGE